LRDIDTRNELLEEMTCVLVANWRWQETWEHYKHTV